MRRCLTAAIGLGLLLTACDDGASGESPDPAPIDATAGDMDPPEPDAQGPITDFGEPCDGPDDCQSGYCLSTPAGGVCTGPCLDDDALCPDDWSCVDSVVFGESVCQPDEQGPPGELCDPCEDDRDCGGPDDQCLPLGGSQGPRVCARDCADDACPAGYECRPIGLGRQCRPVGDVCPEPDGGLRFLGGQFLSAGSELSTDTYRLRLTLGSREPIHRMQTQGPLRLRLFPISSGRTP